MIVATTPSGSLAGLATLRPQTIGLLAGAGHFPLMFAEAARKQGLRVVGVGVSGMAPDELPSLCHEYTEVGLARLGAAIRAFRRGGVSQAVMAGKIEKTRLMQRFRWLKLLPDWRTVHMWMCYAARDRKDDTLLLAVIQEFARDGIQFGSALDYCPEILVKHGFLTQRRPSAAQWKDIHFGWQLAKEMGRLDVGQSVAVHDLAVLAVEAIEGTDRAIRRAGELCPRGGFTVVKVAKPQQDMRFDVPTIGEQTILTLHAAGGRVLAVEAEKTIILKQEQVIALAERLGVVMVALHAHEAALPAAA
jgi:UDP-2,3-diacylglucosamine hydrolase